MADLFLRDLFGENVIYDNNSKTISFNVDDFASSDFDTSGINPINIDSYASRLLWAILNRLFSLQPETNNDETRGIYVTNQAKRNAVRNSVAQFSFGLLVSAYTPDNLGVTLAPDELVSLSASDIPDIPTAPQNP